MSLFKPTTLTCPACRADVPFDAVHSINADRRPDLRLAILAETFQQQACPNCRTVFRLDPQFNFMDLENHQWINAAPLAALGDWKAQEATAQGLFDEVYGEQAPDAAREIGASLNRRVTFGWAALREKLLAAANGLDDVTLELCKSAVLRSGTPAPVSAATELRLIAVEGDELVFGWLLAADESLGPVLRVSRALYDQIALDADGDWEDLRAEIDAGLFVDLNRLLIAGAPAA